MLASSPKAEPARYQPRAPEATILHQAVLEHLEAFLADASERGHRLPPFVETTFYEFLNCGDPTHGFVRVHCDRCRLDRFIAFSCKRRGLCPSCGGRRMAEVAANLVDRVLPAVPMRQWVLSLPVSLRYRIAYDGALLTPILDAFIRAVFASLRHRARARYGVHRPQCGAVTIVQRFGGAINLNVHFHTLAFDGVYVVDSTAGTVEFLRLPAPSTEEVGRVLADAARRIARCLDHRGLGADADPDVADPLAHSDPLLARLYAASVQGRVPDGARAGRRTTRIGTPIDLPPTDTSRCAVADRMSLHAGVYVPATDRYRLERVCRYMARPPLATNRLARLADGRIAYRLRHPWRDGTTGLIFEPREFLARLASLIPPPRAHQLRYHGILAPAAAWRDKIVPDPDSATHGSPSVARKNRPSWAMLLKRVFALDALHCARCGGRMRVLAAITGATTIARFSIYLGGTRAPPPDSTRPLLFPRPLI